MDDSRPAPPNEPVHEVELQSPIPAWGTTLDKVPFYRRPTAGDLEWIQDTGHEGIKGTLFMLNRLTLVPIPSLRKLDAYDYAVIERTLANFLQRGPQDGRSD